MTSQTSDTKFYDLFKLLVSLLLLLVIVILLTSSANNQNQPTADNPTSTQTTEKSTLPSPSPTQMPEPTESIGPVYPAFPEPKNQPMVFDESLGCIVNAEGQRLYCLDPTDTFWIPWVPEEIASQFPVPVEPQQSQDGRWILPGENQDIIYYWAYINHTWVLVEREEPEEPIATPIPPIVDCPGALPPLFKARDKAKLTTNLNFRSSPGLLTTNWIQTNLTGTILTILGETACTAYDFGSYRWWKVQLDSGAVGWSAEGSATGIFYFLELVE